MKPAARSRPQALSVMTVKELRERHSVRSYDASREIPEELRQKLLAEATMVNSHEAGLNFRIVFDSDAPFRGFARSYGMFKGVRNYLAPVIDPTFPDAEERAGYFAEQFVMACVESGLGTCFVSGTFSRDNVDVRTEVYETVPFVVPFGFDEGKPSLIARITASAAHRKRMDARDFFDGTEDEYASALHEFPWLQTGLEAVACAPSALNRRPVRISVKEIDGERRVVASVPDLKTQAIDLGIAKFNFQAAVGGIWDWGNAAAFYKDV